MLLSILHETTYRYSSPVRHSTQLLRLTPRAEPQQRLLNWSIEAPGRLWHGDDAYGNRYHTLVVSEPHMAIRVLAKGTVEVGAPLRPGILARREEHLSPLAFLTPTRLTEPTAALRDFAATHLPETITAPEDLLDPARAVAKAMTYQTGVTESHTTAAEALEHGYGVCQDHAHVFISCCRCRGVPARYVSGYLEAGATAHAATHAWVEAWLADFGWVSIDVTHGELVGERHCSLAIGRDFESASPIRGVRTGGGSETLEVSVSVAPDQ